MDEANDTHWWLLIHQISAQPAYLRVKVARQLRRIGAVAVKNTVYVLPATDAAREDFQWVMTEIAEGGGEALIADVRVVEGLSDEDVRQLFRDERDADYAAIAEEARKLAAEGARAEGESARGALEAGSRRLERRLEEIAEIDFFDAPGHVAAQALVEALRKRCRDERTPAESAAQATQVEDWVGRTWVTRTGVMVDRIASAWLVRRFIDEHARFKFVPAKGYAPEPAEVRFDMFEAEFTHEGELCTFEVLIKRLGVRARGLDAIAEIVHDIDLKDAKYGRAETRGVAAAIQGLAAICPSDEERLERGFVLFDSLLAALANAKRPP